MKATLSALLVLFLQSSNLIAQSESEICRRLFVSAGDIAKESKFALDLAAQAVWGASEMNGNNLTLTGTLTQTNPSLDTWSYSSTPNDKLVIQFSGSVPVEIAFTSFDGWLQGTWEDFTNSHRVDFTIAVGADYDLRVQSESLPDNVETKYTWQRQLTGTLPFDGELTTADLLHSGTTTYELSSGYAYYHYQEACTGSTTNASMATTVNDQYFATIRHNSNQGQYAVNKGILSNSSTAIGGNTYAYQSGMVQWAAYTNFPDSASAGIYNKVLDPGFWQSSGTLTKNGVHYGTLGFDRSVVADSDGPYLVLHTTGGPSYLLHPLLHPAVTGITPPRMDAPAGFELHGNFPNPFNPETQIPFELSRSAHVRLEVFDARGRRVATLVNTVLPPGRHARLWNAAEMPSGIYWYRLESDGKRQTKKMVLMK